MLGLLALGLPIYRRSGSASVTVYALSILPRTVVAMRGLRQVPFRRALLITMYLIGLLFIFVSAFSSSGEITLFHWVTVLVLPIVVMLLIVATFNATRGDLNLPDVRISVSDSEIAVGKLLDHSEGTWHFFDEEWTLKAIPDGQVIVAEIYDKSDKSPSPNEA